MKRHLLLLLLLCSAGCASARQDFSDGYDAGQNGITVDELRDARKRGISIEDLKDEPGWYAKHMVYSDSRNGHTAIGGLKRSSDRVSEASLQLDPDTNQWELIVRFHEDANPYHSFSHAEVGGSNYQVEEVDYDVSCSSGGCGAGHLVALPISRAALTQISKVQKSYHVKVLFKNQAREQEWVALSPVAAKVALKLGK
jgi:hypothetical protein